MYSLCGEVLQQVDQAKYLGVMISQELDWSAHIESTCRRANSTLGFLRRNLKASPEKLKELAYFSLVRSVLEYGCVVWDPHLVKDISEVEMVQRRGARFVKGKYRWDDGSVTEMINALGWTSLANRRRDLRLTLMYKVVNSLVAVPADDLLTPADTRTRAHNNKKFKHISANTANYKNSYFPRTVRDWEELDVNLTTSPTLTSFKERL